MYQYDSKDKYVAYVGTYTHGSSIGIHVYDLDVENGYMTEREVIPVNNASHVALSTSGKYLYSIADEGVAVMKINDDGGLTPINEVGIDGMRGCFLSTDKSGKFLFVGGYHDGKVTVVHTHRDGRLGSVLDGIFQRNCKVRITREGEQVFEGELASLKRFKDDVKEVKAGYECGLVFDGFNDVKEEDKVEAYIMVEVPR